MNVLSITKVSEVATLPTSPQILINLSILFTIRLRLRFGRLKFTFLTRVEQIEQFGKVVPFPVMTWLHLLKIVV